VSADIFSVKKELTWGREWGVGVSFDFIFGSATFFYLFFFKSKGLRSDRGYETKSHRRTAVRVVKEAGL
jgi:hypothetical protein